MISRPQPLMSANNKTNITEFNSNSLECWFQEHNKQETYFKHFISTHIVHGSFSLYSPIYLLNRQPYSEVLPVPLNKRDMLASSLSIKADSINRSMKQPLRLPQCISMEKSLVFGELHSRPSIKKFTSLLLVPP